MGSGASVSKALRCENCQKDVNRSCMVQETCDILTLMCTACCQEYKLRNTCNLRSAITKKPWLPCQEELVVNPGQLGPGDVIGFKEAIKKGAFDYKHMVVLIQWDTSMEKGNVAELTQIPLRNQVKIDKDEVDLSELLKQFAFVVRYQPMDCLPLKETLRRATESIGKVLGVKDTCLTTAANFVSWCKCGTVKKK